mgnify:CR=1 FL=1
MNEWMNEGGRSERRQYLAPCFSKYCSRSRSRSRRWLIRRHTYIPSIKHRWRWRRRNSCRFPCGASSWAAMRTNSNLQNNCNNHHRHHHRHGPLFPADISLPALLNLLLCRSFLAYALLRPNPPLPSLQARLLPQHVKNCSAFVFIDFCRHPFVNSQNLILPFSFHEPLYAIKKWQGQWLGMDDVWTLW